MRFCSKAAAPVQSLPLVHEEAERSPMADPVTDEMISSRFVDPPNWSAIGGGIFSVSVSLEVMP